MYYPELDTLCHEVAGQLSELRRLTMESPVLTDDQTVLLAELTRLLRLVNAVSSQYIHSLLGDTAVVDAEFVAELRGEFEQLLGPAPQVAVGHAPREAATPVLPPETLLSSEEGEPLERVAAQASYPRRWPLEGRDPAHQFAFCDINGSWWLIRDATAMRFASRIELDRFLTKHWDTERATLAISWPPGEEAHTPPEVSVPGGMLDLLYWDITPESPGDRHLSFARDAEQKWCIIIESQEGQIALVFDSETARTVYMEQVYRGARNEREAVEDQN